MLTYHRTSLLDSDAQTVVNTVNTVGVMGKGLAAALKDREPEMFAAYKRICNQNLLDIGKLWLWRSSDQWVLNFPTKKHWRLPSKIEYIHAGLGKFVSTFEEKGIREIAFPRLGCGNGGLDWEEVRSVMHDYLNPLPIRVYVHDFAVDLSLPEHNEYSPIFAENSFHDFMIDIGHSIELNGNSFQSVDGTSEFSAFMELIDEEHRLKLEGEDWKIQIDEFDLSELWVMLNKGPVDRSRLVGLARDFSAQIFSILSTISYLRLVSLSTNCDSSAIAIEKNRRVFSMATAAA